MRRRGLPGAAGLPAGQRRVGYAAVSAVLRYPDEQLLRDLPLLRAAAGTLPAAVGGPLRGLVSHLASAPLLDLQAAYVAVFDLQRRCCLYLSYYLNGDTRHRGGALLRFRDAYRQAGLRLTGSELPDYLPMLLELAASGEHGEEAALGLIHQHRQGLRMLLAALEAARSPYALALRALEALLPPASPAAVAQAARLAREGPPAELVGMEPAAASAVGPAEGERP